MGYSNINRGKASDKTQAKARSMALLNGENVLLVTRPTLKRLAIMLVIRLFVIALGAKCIMDASQSGNEMLGLSGGVFCACGLLSILIQLPIKFIKLRSLEYTITNKRILSKGGIISVDMKEVRIADVRGVAMRKTIWGRLLNFGSVAVGTSATAGTEILIVDVDNPSEVVELINKNRTA